MRSRALLLSAVVALLSTGCVKTIAINTAADALAASGGTTFASDEDPELVRDAIPFALKTIESLIAAAPENPKLLQAATSGFAQYAYAFVLQDADIIEPEEPARARALTTRARKLFARARRYGMRGLEARHQGFGKLFEKNRALALRETEKEDVPLLYWTGAAWGAQISVSKDQMDLVGQLPWVEALMKRALQLDPAFEDGAIHEFFLAYEAGRAGSGGSLDRAREHLERVEVLSGGGKLAPYVTWAEAVSVQKQDRKEFDRLLTKVLAFDVDSAPRYRLSNLIAQARARRMQERAGDLFLEE